MTHTTFSPLFIPHSAVFMENDIAEMDLSFPANRWKGGEKGGRELGMYVATLSPLLSVFTSLITHPPTATTTTTTTTTTTAAATSTTTTTFTATPATTILFQTQTHTHFHNPVLPLLLLVATATTPLLPQLLLTTTTATAFDRRPLSAASSASPQQRSLTSAHVRLTRSTVKQSLHTRTGSAWPNWGTGIFRMEHELQKTPPQ
mmetsp:Transcript_21560/g.30199  ORF Transcript_21560/g.30199 Transcript_21560/m.30199 type:complete len:203 (-) Transcript_21560:474-1082(-)